MSSQCRGSEAQALDMSERYGIPITEEQVKKYVSEREKDEAPTLYDTDIFERVLNPEQKKLFSEARLKQRSRLQSSQSQSPSPFRV